MNRRSAIAALLCASLPGMAQAVEFGPKQVALLIRRDDETLFVPVPLG